MRILLLTALLVTCSAAQLPVEPPPVLQLVRQTGAGESPYAATGAAVDIIGMAAITGPAETWYFEAHPSFASIEDLDRRLSAAAPAQSGDPGGFNDEVLASSRKIIALHRPGLSRRPIDAVRMFPRARYFRVSLYRIRPGPEAGFEELLRANDPGPANVDRPTLVYQVVSGAPAGTFLVLAPLTSLKTLDDAIGAFSGRGPHSAEASTVLVHENLLFRVEPRASFVSDTFAASDTAFWRGAR